MAAVSNDALPAGADDERTSESGDLSAVATVRAAGAPNAVSARGVASLTDRSRVETLRRPQPARPVGADGVIVTHGPCPQLEDAIASLAAQVDELVVVANVPVELPPLPRNATLLSNDKPVGFAANLNRGVAATSAPCIVVANPDAVAGPSAVRELVRFLGTHPRCGITGPQIYWPDGRWQPTRRRFPTVAGTIVRRSPLRMLYRPLEWQRRHYLLDEHPTEPTPTEWMVGAFLCYRRSMLEDLGGMDEGFRLYCEEIDLCYRANQAGWERWYIPDAVVSHAWEAVSDRRFLDRRSFWHLRGILRFVRKHPERLLAIV
jgi:GT2 family glycosyltransferase